VLWTAFPSAKPIGVILMVCGLMNLIRLVRWTGYRTFPDRLVLILHVAYAFIPVGFVLSGLSTFEVVAPSAGIHAWTGGAIGVMTLAVMTRAALGHTGRPLQASLATQLVYLAIVLAAVTRICAAIEVDHAATLLIVSGVSWSVAFLGFSLAFFVPLWRPRAK
jgi:uncharacterized protein involved in response to NO